MSLNNDLTKQSHQSLNISLKNEVFDRLINNKSKVIKDADEAIEKGYWLYNCETF